MSTDLAAAARPAPAHPAEQTVAHHVEVERLGGTRRTRRRPPRALTRLLGVAVAIAGWQVASSSGALSPSVVGSPRSVLRTAGHLLANGQLGSAIGASLQRVAWGVVIGVLVGVVLALVSGLSRLGADLVDAPVQMLRTVPFAGIIPLLIVWLGVGETPKIVLIALATTFPIYINLSGGIRSVDPGLLEAGRTLGLSRVGLVVHVVLPSSLPQFLIGLRLALGISWLALVFAEQISAVNGLGYLMTTAQELLQTNTIVVCLAVYGLLGLLVDALVRVLERVLLAWRPQALGA